jgi:hypothetical protein
VSCGRHKLIAMLDAIGDAYHGSDHPQDAYSLADRLLHSPRDPHVDRPETRVGAGKHRVTVYWVATGCADLVELHWRAGPADQWRKVHAFTTHGRVELELAAGEVCTVCNSAELVRRLVADIAPVKQSVGPVEYETQTLH